MSEPSAPISAVCLSQREKGCPLFGVGRAIWSRNPGPYCYFNEMCWLERFQGRQGVLESCFGIGEEHQCFVGVEQGVVDTGETG